MTTASETVAPIRWGRALLGGFLIELVLTIVSVPFFATGREADPQVVVPPATLVVAALFGAWTARKASGRYLLHGALAGAAAFLIYLLLIAGNVLFAPVEPDFTAALSPAYLASHVLKVLGGALGGWWIARKRG